MVAILSERRNSVVISSRDGNVDISTGSFVPRTIIKIPMARDILHDRPMSSRNVGSGIKRVARTATSPAAKIKLLFEANLWVSNPMSFCLSVSAIFFPLDRCRGGPWRRLKKFLLLLLFVNLLGLFRAYYFLYPYGKAAVHDDDVSGGEIYVLNVKLGGLSDCFVEL